MSADPLFADTLITEIQRRIRGRIAHERNNCNYLAWAVAQAGNGDHLEIGTMFGGSAILAALVKKTNGLEGDVYCVDPLNGYYVKGPYPCMVDPTTHEPITPDVVMENAREFGVEDRIHLITEYSNPWPAALEGHTFTSAYIDGDHWGVMPLWDWQHVAPITSGLVVFDNYDYETPAVIEACNIAAAAPGWKQELCEGMTFIVRRHE